MSHKLPYISSESERHVQRALDIIMEAQLQIHDAALLLSKVPGFSSAWIKLLRNYIAIRNSWLSIYSFQYKCLNNPKYSF